MNLKKSLFIGLCFFGNFAAQAQNSYYERLHKLADNTTFVSSTDGENITFYKNGAVAINRKLNKSFRWAANNITGSIDLYFKNKRINQLYEDDACECDCICFKDDRGISYRQLK